MFIEPIASPKALVVLRSGHPGVGQEKAPAEESWRGLVVDLGQGGGSIHMGDNGMQLIKKLKHCRLKVSCSAEAVRADTPTSHPLHGQEQPMTLAPSR